MTGRRLAAAACLCLAALIVPAPATAKPLPQSAVKAKPPPVNEESPSAAPGEFAWVQSSRLHPHLYNAYAQINGGARFRVNAPGTQAGVGTGIDGHMMVYTQVLGSQRSIRLFNLETHARHAPPAGVNTANLEDEPSISGNWLLFHRREFGSSPGQQVLLVNLTSGASRLLASVHGTRGFVEAGQVNGNFAVFTKSKTGVVFNVWRYNISRRALTVIPNPRGRVHTSAAVNPFGTVYYEQSGAACGSNATVEEYPIGGPVFTAGTLKPGVDLFHPFLFEKGGLDQYLFAKLHCRGAGIDIYKTMFS